MKRTRPPRNFDAVFTTPVAPLRSGRLPRSHIPEDVSCWDSVPVVYFLMHEAEIIYIGSTTTLHTRLRAHRNGKINSRNARKDFTTVGIMYVPAQDLFQVEAKYIRLYQPVLNRTIKTNIS